MNKDIFDVVDKCVKDKKIKQELKYWQEVKRQSRYDRFIDFLEVSLYLGLFSFFCVIVAFVSS